MLGHSTGEYRYDIDSTLGIANVAVAALEGWPEAHMPNGEGLG